VAKLTKLHNGGNKYREWNLEGGVDSSWFLGIALLFNFLDYKVPFTDLNVNFKYCK